MTKLDRLARSAADLYAIVHMLEGKCVAFKVLTLHQTSWLDRTATCQWISAGNRRRQVRA
ncbi:hypothetical protein [Rhizobium sp. RAF56]|uniref:hypothetical protein n=1 Tax=Rhizobium sp. RAF56 TaxID=3233062 RepID=UPI003F9DF0D1